MSAWCVFSGCMFQVGGVKMDQQKALEIAVQPSAVLVVSLQFFLFVGARRLDEESF